MGKEKWKLSNEVEGNPKQHMITGLGRSPIIILSFFFFFFFSFLSLAFLLAIVICDFEIATLFNGAVGMINSIDNPFLVLSPVLSCLAIPIYPARLSSPSHSSV